VSPGTGARTSAGATPLLDAACLRQLERLSIAHLGALLEGTTGPRRTVSGGLGLEFADYRPYAPGDDLRRVDWNIYARLGEPFVKTAQSEARVALTLLIDASRSMGEGSPSKFRHAETLAAMLAAVAVLHGDSAEVHLLEDGGASTTGVFATPQHLFELIVRLEAAQLHGRTDLAGSVRAHRRLAGGADVAVLLSDALVEPEALRLALGELAASAPSATLVHITGADDPLGAAHGPLRLRDSETGETLLVNVDRSLVASFRARAERLASEVRELAAGAGVGYVRASTATAPLELLLAAARRGELLAA
jgi:uncharacterized protein (DUF58 family)